MSRLVPLPLLLLGSSVGLLGCAQGMEGVTPSSSASHPGTEQITDTRVRPVGGEHPSLDSLPWARDALGAPKRAKAKAFEAAEVDPGILMYTEPPPGTRTPVYTPPETVDPEMIWPQDP